MAVDVTYITAVAADKRGYNTHANWGSEHLLIIFIRNQSELHNGTRGPRPTYNFLVPMSIFSMARGPIECILLYIYVSLIGGTVNTAGRKCRFGNSRRCKVAIETLPKQIVKALSRCALIFKIYCLKDVKRTNIHFVSKNIRIFLYLVTKTRD